MYSVKINLANFRDFSLNTWMHQVEKDVQTIIIRLLHENLKFLFLLSSK